MLDFSASMTSNIELVKAATEQFLLRMLPDDKGQVGAFSDKIQFSGTFTSDRDDLIAALKDLQFGNPTRLYDAIYASIERLQDVEGRRIMRRLADETGGGYFELKRTTDLAPTFTSVAAELHSLYAIGFTPTVFDNKEHKLEAKMKTQGHVARARRTYIASAERLSSMKWVLSADTFSLEQSQHARGCSHTA